MATIAACVTPEAEVSTTTQNAFSYVTAVANAHTSYASVVSENVRANAASVGITVSAAAIRSIKVRGMTIATVAAPNRDELVFVAKPFTAARQTLSAGLYRIAQTEKGPVYLYHSPTGPVDLGLVAPARGPSAFHTDAGDDLCGDAPGGLMDYCQAFVACSLYEYQCPEAPGGPEIPVDP